MAKRWEDHSPAWRSKHAAQGMTAKRWNAWLELSPSTKKQTKQTDYAAGKNVPTQRREKLEALAYAKMRAVSSGKTRPGVIKNNISKMTNEELRWTADATPNQITRRASLKHVPGHATNPWWYR